MTQRLYRLFKRQFRRFRQPVHISNRNGRFQIEGLDAWYYYWRDPYHLMLTIPWPGFVAVVSLGYVSINVIFALLYLAGGNCLIGARPGVFEDAFFFSVHTLGSIGYGIIAPKNTYANLIVTLEGITSLLTIAVVTGLTFARFSRPTARVVFSESAVVTHYNGLPTLMFRAANKRRNQILEAQTRIYFTRDEVTTEGYFMRRFYDLKLSRHRSPSFTLTWSIMHPIDEDSPLYALTPELLEETHAQLIVSLSGMDETVADMIHARHTYSAQDILWNYKFVDIIRKLPTGDRYIDYTHFHQVIPVSQPLEQHSEKQASS
jgi:inward rectifier potassium channel